MNTKMVNRRQFLNLSTGAATLMMHRTLSGNELALQQHVRSAEALGTQVNITVFHPEETIANQAIDAALERIEHVEQLMSLYRPDSQLSLLNRRGVLRHPHPDLVAVLTKAAELSRLTRGAFDVTVQPLWKLYADRAGDGALPTEGEIEKVRQRIGWQHIRIESDIIYFDRAGMQVTLNGVAQGLAADLAQQALKERGIKHALIDAGELNAMGSPSRKESWHIAIQHHRQQSERIAKTGLQDRCLSTSGDYATRFSDDYRHHHLLDPRTGLSPAKLASVSVAAPSALEADALSTAIFIIGPEQGKELVESMNLVDALFVSKSGEVVTTEGFDLI
jgi:thiamine biosynthesis lipoprotein